MTWIMAGAGVMALVVLAWLLIKTRTALHQLEYQARHREQALRHQLEHAEWLRENLLNTVEDALLVLDSERRIVFANPAAQIMLGRDLMGQTLIGAIRQPELEALIEDARRVHGEGMERRIEYERHILHARAVVLQNGSSLMEVLTLRDVTEIQRLERARREMVSNITHELSTPITAIGLLAETLLNLATRDKPKRVRKMAADIQREANTLAHLVQEMRDLSLIESGQMLVRMTPANLRAVIWGGTEPLLPLAESKQLTITLDISPDISVLVDELQIQRAIKNIVHNAVKFSPAGRTIYITATTGEDEAVIAIRDQGPGIPADDLPRVFERFFQVDRSRRHGTGLGLAIVRHIVLAHGGRVWAESVEGEGATFYIALALAEVPIED